MFTSRTPFANRHHSSEHFLPWTPAFFAMSPPACPFRPSTSPATLAHGFLHSLRVLQGYLKEVVVGIYVYTTRTNESEEDLFQVQNLLGMTKEGEYRSRIKETDFKPCKEPSGNI